MAYMKRIYNECQRSGCRRTATFTVFGIHNDSFGRFCKKHAEELIAKLKQREKSASEVTE